MSVSSITPPGVDQSVCPPRRTLRTSRRWSSTSSSAPATVHSLGAAGGSGARVNDLVASLAADDRARRPYERARAVQAVARAPACDEPERLDDDAHRH